MILEYLDTLLPENWDRNGLYQRRNFLEGADVLEGTVKRDKVCVLEIWCECFGKNRADLKKSDSLEINDILSRLDGWSNADKT